MADIIAGRDPRIPPRPVNRVVGVQTVADFLDRYVKECVKPKKWASVASVESRVKVLKTHLGHLPALGLEHPDAVNAFRQSEYAEDLEPASVNRVLEVLRNAINWGMHGVTPELLNRSPFHRFGITLDKRAETQRDRRLRTGEEARLLAAAQKMNNPEHKHVGSAMHDRIIGALELCCRRGEMLAIQNRHVDVERHEVAIPGANAKDRENRRIPYDPKGRLAPILARRAELGPAAFVFGTPEGQSQDNIQTAWETLRLLANGLEPRRGPAGESWNREQLVAIDLHWHDLRHEGACRLLSDGVDVRHIQLMLGHATLAQTQRYLNVTDAELRKGMEVSWKQRRRLRSA